MEGLVNPQAEAAVVAALFKSPSLVDEAVVLLGADGSKFGTNSRYLYEAILVLGERGTALDTVTLCDYLHKCASPNISLTQLQFLGEKWIKEVLDTPIQIANVKDYAKSVRDSYISRRIADAGTRAMDLAFRYQNDPDTALDILDAELSSIRESEPEDFSPIQESIAHYAECLDKKIEDPSFSSGYRHNIGTLDTLIDAFYPGQLITIAGRPAMGKSMLALAVAVQIASHHGPVAFISIEMTPDQMASRILAHFSGLDSKIIKTNPGSFTPDQSRNLQGAIAKLHEGKVPLMMYHKNPNVVEVAALSRRMQKRLMREEKNLGAVVIDYLQLMSSIPGIRYETRTQEISDWTRRLKVMAVSINVPIIIVSQLSRAVEHRQEKRPILSDLRESGSIEQDSDIVIFSYSDLEANNKGDAERKRVLKDFEPGWEPWELIVAKNREGTTGVSHCALNKTCGRYRSLARG